MKSPIHATLAIVLLAGLCLPLQVQAQACPSSIGLRFLTPDGTPTSLNIGGGQTSSFLGDLSAGRSYSLDIVSSSGIAGGAATTLPVVARQPGGSDCSFPLTERTLTDPKIVVGAVGGQAMAGRRFTFLAPTSGHYDFFVTNNDFFNLARDFTARLVETTLFSPRWSTFGGFYTSWGIQNTTNAAINVTLRVIPGGSSTPLATATFSVDPGEVVFRDTRPTDLNLAANQAGNVVLTHNGPPGAIQADAFMVNESGAVVEAIPAKFDPARQQR